MVGAFFFNISIAECIGYCFQFADQARKRSMLTGPIFHAEYNQALYKVIAYT